MIYIYNIYIISNRWTIIDGMWYDTMGFIKGRQTGGACLCSGWKLEGSFRAVEQGREGHEVLGTNWKMTFCGSRTYDMPKSFLKSSRCSLCGGAEGHCSMLAPMGGHAKDADESYPIATGFIAMPATQRLGFCWACYLEVPHPVADMSNYMCLNFYAVHLLRSASWLPEQGVATACWFVNHASFGDGEGEILQLNWRMLPPPFQARRGKILEILQLPDIWKDSIRRHSCVGLCDDIST